MFCQIIFQHLVMPLNYVVCVIAMGLKAFSKMYNQHALTGMPNFVIVLNEFFILLLEFLI